LKNLFHTSLAEDEDFVTFLVNAASDLYPAELLPEIDQAFQEGRVDTMSIDQDWIQEMLDQGKEYCLLKNVYENEFHSPIGDVKQEMEWMAAFQPRHNERGSSFEENESDNGDGFYFDSPPVRTYIREIKAGRNDPCPCGSGKKYKKCCLK